jgi:hypothetical protein
LAQSGVIGQLRLREAGGSAEAPEESAKVGSLFIGGLLIGGLRGGEFVAEGLVYENHSALPFHLPKPAETKAMWWTASGVSARQFATPIRHAC